MPDSVTDAPEQTVEDGAMVIPTDGCAFTFRTMLLVFVQPLAAVPVTVYVVVAVGENETPSETLPFQE